MSLFNPKSVTGWLSGGLMEPSSPNYAGLALTNERQRQALINAGMSNINAVFGGGTTPIYTPYTTKATKEAWGPDVTGQQYFTINKQGEFTPYKIPGTQPSTLWNNVGQGVMAGHILGGVGGDPGMMLLGGLLGGGLFGGSGTSPRGAFNKMIKKGNLYTVENKTFKGFGPEFYNQVMQDYINFAFPQLADQYRRAQATTQFGLQNRGLYGSSAMDKAFSDLNLAAGRQQQSAVDTARSTAQQTQRQVEEARQQAIQQLYATADPAQARASAINMAAQFNVPQTFTPIVNAFTNIANQYAARRSQLGAMPYYSAPDYESGTPAWMGQTSY